MVEAKPSCDIPFGKPCAHANWPPPGIKAEQARHHVWNLFNQSYPVHPLTIPSIVTTRVGMCFSIHGRYACSLWQPSPGSSAVCLPKLHLDSSGLPASGLAQAAHLWPIGNFMCINYPRNITRILKPNTIPHHFATLMDHMWPK